MSSIVAFNPCFVCPKDGKCSMCELNMYRQGTLSNPQWIRVEERLPDKYKSVLISCEDEVRIDCIDAYGLWHDNYPYRVTHWMPLPEAPKMTRKEDEGK